MECKLTYMEAQVEEAQHTLGRKHASMVAAQEQVEGLEAACARLTGRADEADATLAAEQVKELPPPHHSLLHAALVTLLLVRPFAPLVSPCRGGYHA
jgi:uncharacterized coiled-coil protein SlyX